MSPNTSLRKRRMIVRFYAISTRKSHVASDLERSFERRADERRTGQSNVNVTTLGVPLASQGVVPSYGSSTPYQIHLYKRGHRDSTGQHITVGTLGRVLVGKFPFESTSSVLSTRLTMKIIVSMSI